MDPLQPRPNLLQPQVDILRRILDQVGECHCDSVLVIDTHDRLESVRVDEMQERLPLYAGLVLVAAKQDALRFQAHHEPLECSSVAEQAVALVAVQPLPLFGELDDQADLIRPVSVEGHAWIGQARHQTGGQFRRNRHGLGRPAEDSFQLLLLCGAVGRVDDEEVHVQHFGHQLKRRRRRVRKLSLQLVKERLPLRFVWLVEEPLTEFTQRLARPDRFTWSEERIVTPEATFYPGRSRCINGFGASES